MILEVVKEVLVLPLYPLAGILCYIFKLRPQEHPSSKGTVVIVPGWFTSPLLYLFLKRYLERAGFTVYIPNFGLQLGDFFTTAKRLKEYVERYDLNNITLVGSSAGALVARVYLQKMGGWNRVRLYISVGGPHMGTPIAILTAFSKASRQMLPDSDFIKSLNQEPLRYPSRTLFLSAKYDEFVPRSSSQLTQGTNKVLDVVGHVHLQAFSQETYKAIAQYAES